MRTKPLLRSSFVLMLGFLASTAAHAATPDEQAQPSAWEQVVEMYEKAKEAGEQVPKDIYQWAKEDLGRIGDWEYQIVDLNSPDSSSVQTRLNELGADRWECIWIQPLGETTRFVFKRPARSYLKNIPLSQLMKLFPGGSADDQDG